MTLQELEALKQERLADQEPRLEVARANAERAEKCVERFRAAGFHASRQKLWELDPSSLRDSDLEGIGDLFVENKRISLAEAERLVAELENRQA